MNFNPVFDYDKEPVRDILCLDYKTFYASVEARELGLDPLKVKLVVLSQPPDHKGDRGSGLILAASTAAKKEYGLTNVSRERELPYPYPPDLIIVPPRMNIYLRYLRKINDIYRNYVDESNLAILSVDESFLDVTESLKYFGCETAYELARKIQIDVYRQVGIYITAGIGENPYLAKMALLHSKKNADMKAEILYDDVPEKIWRLTDLTDLHGVGERTARKLRLMGIHTVYDLANCADFDVLVKKFGIVKGTELFCAAWGIDRSFLGEKYIPTSRSISSNQTLPRDYTNRSEIEILIREMADAVGYRLRKSGMKTGKIRLSVIYPKGFASLDGKIGFQEYRRIDRTNSTKEISNELLSIFDKYYKRQDVRNINVSCYDLEYATTLQLDLFEDSLEKIKQNRLDSVIDVIRKKYNFSALIYAHSLMPGARAVIRSQQVNGHAGGATKNDKI